MKVIQFLKARLELKHILGIGLGMLAGYAYWYFYGCLEGCTITGSALNSTLYFGMMGYFAAGLIPAKKEEESASEPQEAGDHQQVD